MLHSPDVKSRRRPWWLKILVTIVTLLVFLFIAAEILFLTDLPRSLVVSIVEKQFGLRISARSLSTGVFGYTTLGDVTVTLPLADKAFLTVPELKINHTWLPGIIFGFFSVHDITLTHPHLQVVQEPDGGWNLLEVLQLLGRTGSGNSQQQAAKPEDIPLLPALDVTDASLTITDNQQRSTTLSNLQVTGRPDGPLVWKYHAAIADQLDLTGKLAPGGSWAHELDIQIKNAAPWMSPWISTWPTSAQAEARWTGQVDSGNLKARLDIIRANYNSLSVSGPLEISTEGSSTTLRPAGILFTRDSSELLSTRIVRGQITFTSSGINTDNLGLELARGQASLDAKYLFADGSASLHTAWRDMQFPSGVVQSGDLQIDYSAPLGQSHFDATLQNQGISRSGKWNADINLWGSGNNLANLNIDLYARNLTFDSSGGKSLALSGLTANIGGYPGGILLRDLRAGHAHPIDGHGGISQAKHNAWLTLDGHGWHLPGDIPQTLDIDLNIWADANRVHLQQLYLDSGSFNAYASGDYVYSLPKPLSVHAYLAETPAELGTDLDFRHFRGALRSTIDLNGTVAPLDLVLNGSAHGKDVHIAHRPLGDVDLQLNGYFRDDLIYISSQNVKLLGGNWNVSGYWPSHYGIFHIDNLSVDHLSLPLATASPDITGTLDGKWTIDAYELAPDGIVIDGSAKVHDLTLGTSSAAADYLHFDEIDIGSDRLDYGSIHINPINVTRKIGDKTGTATLGLYTTIEHLAQMTVGIDAHSWPLPVSGKSGQCVFSAGAHADLDLARLSAIGHIDLQADTTWGTESLGQFNAALDISDRTINATSIQIKTLNGTAGGDAIFNFDQPYSTQANLDWKNLDLTSLKPFVSSLASLSGKSSGTLAIHPATAPRPLGPLAIDLNMNSENVRFKNFAIGNLQCAAYLGPDRFVLDDSPLRPSKVGLAGGTVHFWGRVARHTDDIYQSLLQLQFQNLELDTVLPAGSKVAKAPGLLSGEITMLGSPHNLGLAVGQGTMTLEESDLAGAGPIAFVYNLMHVSHDAKKPTGSGRIDFNIQNQNAYITAMRYFDRGSEVRLSGEIANLTKLPHSPLSLVVVASARPLASIHIPGFADFDDVLSAIQRGVITVAVVGYLDDPKEKPMSFSDIGQDMKNILFGDSRSSQ